MHSCQHSFKKNSFKSMSCLGKIHQFPRNFLRWQFPGCILSNICSIVTRLVGFNTAKSKQSKKKLPNYKINFELIKLLNFEAFCGS